MGFDLYAISPHNEEEKSRYFRNNVWWWRPLWQYCRITGLITDREFNSGCFNDGFKIQTRKARRIGETLLLYIEDGSVGDYAKEYQQFLDNLPTTPCDTCKETGKMKDGTECNMCHGTKRAKSTNTWYPFSVENVKEFAEFCINSGGFEIC